ncbi:MAG: LysM peptidoglycan-binding domain-containing protein [Paludibacterium sp.]|uniref:lytic transglycosylase n=1 Tax=Paludibacterium sp. TaxID=1917523 RepID=UPI0025D61FF7|nr:LysM peptidoglycan-binding domain-containing protein [Paludibacterium sp.]MBV8048794.1 LysM peptidoglycan-binding domain-containing protein [Paludibacterium sp.]MBV8648879.1 LysM peptidoglycan-binding domain-containing protein [Paludibacterium sp.]
MKRFKPLALALSLLFAASGAAKASNDAPTFVANADQGLAAGLEMMLQNANLLRNGDNVWERLRQGFQMSNVNDDLVQRQTRYYASHPDVFKRTLSRGHKYLFYILNEVERRGMPTEIALLPMVESAFVPTATSPVGAAGLWQFMPTTGRQYGLEQTWWYDGRRDVTAATNAALDYLQTLYAQFGDWSLALAAYNWGEGNLSRSIARTQAAGLPVTYENVRMPAETRSYVPKLLAIRDLLADPANFGVRLDKFPNRPYFVSVSPGRHMDIALAAKLAGISVDEFTALNPAYNLPVYAYKAGRQMLLPVKSVDRFQANLAKWDKPLLTWQVYTPNGEETVDDLANRTGMSRTQLLAVNHINSSMLPAGRPVLVAMKNGVDDVKPLTTADTQVVAADAPDTGKAVLQVAANAVPAQAVDVQPASPAEIDPIASLAAQQPRPAGNDDTVKASAAPAVVKVAMADPVPQMAQASATQHVVAQGDTLYNIARRYNLSVSELKQLNGLTGNNVRVGQVLLLKARATQQVSDAGGDAPAVVATPAPAATLPAQYVVQRGDTVFSIARRFGIDRSQIQRLNSPEQLASLHPGQVVVINNL